MKNKRIECIDTLKFIAIFAVIAIHSFYLTGDAEVLNLKISIFNQLFRFAVPLFLMITGVLFLNKEIILKEYIPKRIIRILYPLLFFTILLYVTNISDHIFYYYWYSWMIIGALFAIPIINKFILNSNESEIQYFLIIFIIFSSLSQLFHFFNIKYAIDISFFCTPVSYLILGYYIFNKKTNYSPKIKIIVSIILFIVSSLIKMKTGSYVYTDDFRSYLDLSFFQVIQVSSVFIFIKTVYLSKKSLIYRFLEIKTVKKWILSVSKASYGMYLVQHPIIFNILCPNIKLLELTGTQSFLLCIIAIIVVFFISWIIVVVMSKIPILNKCSGYA